MKNLLLLAAIFLIPLSGFARLGETHEQCDARYGPKWQPGTALPWSSDIRVYEKNGLRVHVTFLNGVAGHIVFSNVAADVFTADQAWEIIQRNGATREWKDTGKTKDGKGTTMACFDGKHVCAFSCYTGDKLDLMTDAFAVAAHAVVDDQLKKNIADF